MLPLLIKLSYPYWHLVVRYRCVARQASSQPVVYSKLRMKWRQCPVELRRDHYRNVTPKGRKRGERARGCGGVEGRRKEGRHSCPCSTFSSNVLLFGFFHSTARQWQSCSTQREPTAHKPVWRLFSSAVIYHCLPHKYETHIDVNPGEIFSLDQC